MHDHGSIGLSFGNGFFGGKFGFECFWPFPFLFLFSARRTSHRRTGFLVGNQRERTTLGHGFLSFFVYLVTILYCSDIVWSKDLSAYFFCFLSILDREFSFLLFLLSLPLLIGNFLSFLCFLPFFDWEFSFFLCFLPRARFMVSWDFGSRLVEWLDMIYVRVWFGSRIKGMPHIISMTQMQK